MKKRHFSNCLSKEKKLFEANIKKFKELEQSSQENVESVACGGSENKEDCALSESVSSELFLGESDPVLGEVLVTTSGEVPNENFEQLNASEEMKAWAIRNKMSHNSLNDLLKTLRRIGMNGLPLSAKSLLKTSRKKINIQSIPNGEFLYLGIQDHFLSDTFEFLEVREEVLIDVGIDGLTLFNSSNRVLWPILGALVDFPSVTPFVIGCFSGLKKPENINDFMANFSSEANYLRENGIKVGPNQIVLKFDVRIFICDSPARAFVCGVVSFNGKNGCPKCCHEGKYKERRVCFPTEIGVLRSDSSFEQRLHASHHLVQFRHQKSVLEDAGFRMVSQFPLDSMHLVDLGVVKKFLKLLIKKANVTKMNENVSFVSSFFPSEFCRISRSLDEVSHWKATEFRQFLLYSGIFILKDCISSELYYLFLLLHSGIRLLSSERSFRSEADVAQQMLEYFVAEFSRIFGEELVSFNIHGLLHLSGCVKSLGPLDSFSAYRFENFMQFLKKIIKKPNQILQQIFLRLNERQDLKSLSNQTSQFGAFDIDLKKEKDCFCYSKKAGPIKVMELVRLGDSEAIECMVFRKTENFFDEPVHSFAGLGIVVASDLSSDVVKIEKKDIDFKYFCIPYENKFLLIPLLHHLFHDFSN